MNCPHLLAGAAALPVAGLANAASVANADDSAVAAGRSWIAVITAEQASYEEDSLSGDWNEDPRAIAQTG